MPLFFFLSGFLFRYDKYQYILLIKKKINRLLNPFVFIAALFFVIKYCARRTGDREPVNLKSIFTALVVAGPSVALGVSQDAHLPYLALYLYCTLGHLWAGESGLDHKSGNCIQGKGCS